MSDEDAAAFWAAVAGPQDLEHVLEACDAAFRAGGNKFRSELRRDQAALLEEINGIVAEANAYLPTVGDLASTEEAAAFVGEVEGRIAAAARKAELYQSREQVFALPPTAFPQLEQVRVERGREGRH